MGDFQKTVITPVITGSDKPVAPADAPKDVTAKATGGANPEPTPQRPEWCPEKFWQEGKVNQEALAKSFTSLEKFKGKAPEATSPGEPPKTDAPPKESIPGVTAEHSQKYTQELTEGGSLSPESYAELEAAGYAKDVVDNYIAGQRGSAATANAKAVEIKAIAGGEEGYAAMTAWAASNVSPEEVAAFNRVTSSNDPEAIALAVRGLHARYTDANGTEPTLVGGRGNGGGDADVFESRAQVTAAIRSKSYKTDPAFRAAVSAKIARSSVL